MSDEPKVNVPACEDRTFIAQREKEIQAEKQRVLERPLEPELDPA